MKRIALPMALLIVVFALSGCGSGATSTPATVVSTETAPPAAPGVEDSASLLAGFQSAGATAEIVDSVMQDFFTAEGQIIRVNGQDLQVFEYETVEAMESEAS